MVLIPDAGLYPLAERYAGLLYAELALRKVAGLLAIMKLAGELKFDKGEPPTREPT
jgi:hypothetical protein